MPPGDLSKVAGAAGPGPLLSLAARGRPCGEPPGGHYLEASWSKTSVRLRVDGDLALALVNDRYLVHLVRRRMDREGLLARLVAENAFYRAYAARVGLEDGLALAALDPGRLGCPGHGLVSVIVYRGLLFGEGKNRYCARRVEESWSGWREEESVAGLLVGVSESLLGSLLETHKPLALCRRAVLVLETGIEEAPRLAVVDAGGVAVPVLCLRGRPYGVALPWHPVVPEEALRTYAGVPETRMPRAVARLRAVLGVAEDMLG